MIFARNARDDAGDGDRIFRTSAEIGIMPWRKDGEALHTAAAELSYDDGALYVRMRAFEKNIISERKQFGDPVCRDSCLEFFFAPVFGNNAYFNFEVNPDGVMYIGFSADGTRAGSRLLTDPDIACNSFFSMKCNRNDDFWEVSYRIPYDFIRRRSPDFRDPRPGDVLRCNFYTCCDDAPELYYTVWHRICSPSPDYHLPEYFGELVFGEKE